MANEDKKSDDKSEAPKAEVKHFDNPKVTTHERQTDDKGTKKVFGILQH